MTGFLWRLRERGLALLVRLGLAQPGKIMYIGGSDTLPAPLSREEEGALIARLEQGAALVALSPTPVSDGGSCRALTPPPEELARRCAP